VVRRVLLLLALCAALAAVAAAPVSYAQDSSNPYGSGGSGSGQSAGGSGQASGGSGKQWASWASMNGKVEVPPGDQAATGRVSVKTKGNQVCYDVSWSGVAPTASHIHKAPAGKAGPIVVPFFKSDKPLTGVQSKKGCVNADAALVEDIGKHPSWYYVNVHTTQYPKGAIRGQLTASAANGALPFTGS
jgi:hypothetical protein